MKEYLKSYESLAAMVVPRSSTQVAADDEYTLFAVAVFKKYAAEFVQKARERRWTPRDFVYKASGKEEEAAEVSRLTGDERKLWGESLRLAHTGYGEAAMVYTHVLTLQVFVETVLRYGLPLDYISSVIKVSADARELVPVWALTSHRQRRQLSRRRRSRRPLTTATLTSEAMLSSATKKAVSRRTMQP